MNDFDEDINSLEDRVFNMNKGNNAILEEIMNLRRSVSRLKRISSRQLDVLYRTSHGEFTQIPKETLPFFREIMRDQEFIDGKLDTGFIPRFNERKKALAIGATTIDMAMISAALAYSKKEKTVSATDGDKAKISKWVLSGREALMQNRF